MSYVICTLCILCDSLVIWYDSNTFSCYRTEELALSRLDYFNCVTAGLPATTMALLQKVLHTAARLVNGRRRSATKCASFCTKRLFAKRHPTWLACWLQSLRSHHDRLFAMRQTATTSFPGPFWNSARGCFLLPPPSMELSANRTQADAFHADFQVPWKLTYTAHIIPCASPRGSRALGRQAPCCGWCPPSKWKFCWWDYMP